MFRPLTVIAITAFSVVGWNVYRAEDAARHLDRDLRDLTKRIEQARDRTQVLRAEWALLNEPERLRQVAQKYLPLETMTPVQFIRLGELDRRLPTAIAFSGPVNLFGSVPGTAVAEGKPAASARPAAVASAAPAPAAAEAPEVAAPVRVAARVAPAPVPHPEHARPEPARAEPARPEPVRAEPAHAEPARPPVAVATRAEEPRRRPMSVPLPVPRAETVALREAPRDVVRDAPRERVVADSPRPGLLRQAIHLPIGSANAATLPQPGTGGSVSPPVSASAGSSLGMASRGTLAPPVPLPVPVR
jgi:hypothetical protein